MAQAQTSLPGAGLEALSAEAAQSVVLLSARLRRQTEGNSPLVEQALLAAWHETADGRDFKAVELSLDRTLASHPENASPLAVLACLQVTGKIKYLVALGRLRNQPSAQRDPAFVAAYAAAYREPLASPLHLLLVPKVSAEAFAQNVDAAAALSLTSPVPVLWRKRVQNQASNSMQWRNASRLDRNWAAYAIAKAVRLGLLPAKDQSRAIALYRSAILPSDADKDQQAIRLLAATEMA